MSHVEAFCSLLDPAELDILDIGAGQGDFVRALCDRGARATGVEVDRAKVARAMAENDVPLLLGSGQDMPVGDASFDVVTFMYSLHHVPPGLHSAALSQAHRVLRQGGTLYVCEPDIEGNMSRIVAAVDDETQIRKQALEALEEPEFKLSFEEVARISYTLERSYQSFEALVEAVVRVDETRQRAFALSESEMRHLFDRLARPTGTGFVISQPSSVYMFRSRQT